MQINLNYGECKIKFNLPKGNIIRILNLLPTKKIVNVRAEVAKALTHPIASPGLKEIVQNKTPKNVILLVEDITRPNPDYSAVLEPIVENLLSCGINEKDIRFVIAYGTHRKHRKEENLKIYGKRLVKEFEFIDHDCDRNLVSMGKLSTGNELLINKIVADADLLITTGNIEPHTFAGYGGGRKAILPGVSGRETITRNHALVVRDGVGLGKLDNNPLHQEMMEAARRVEIDFMLNIIRNQHKEIVAVVAGNWEKAFHRGIKIAEKIYRVTVHKQADVVIASVGGYPKDLNFYQSQKAISVSNEIVKDGGTIILLAECRDGIGQSVFEHWLRQAKNLDEILTKQEKEIEVEGHRAYLSARVLNRCEILVVSSLSKSVIEKLHFTWKKDIHHALEYVKHKHGNDFKAYLMPNASTILPVLKKK